MVYLFQDIGVGQYQRHDKAGEEDEQRLERAEVLGSLAAYEVVYQIARAVQQVDKGVAEAAGNVLQGIAQAVAVCVAALAATVAVVALVGGVAV